MLPHYLNKFIFEELLQEFVVVIVIDGPEVGQNLFVVGSLQLFRNLIPFVSGCELNEEHLEKNFLSFLREGLLNFVSLRLMTLIKNFGLQEVTVIRYLLDKSLFFPLLLAASIDFLSEVGLEVLSERPEHTFPLLILFYSALTRATAIVVAYLSLFYFDFQRRLNFFNTFDLYIC